MINWMDVLVQEQRRQTALETAEQYRLLRNAAGQPKDRRNIAHRALAMLGDKFVDWGRRLQTRYGKLMPSPNETNSGFPLSTGRFAAEAPGNIPPCTG